MLGRRLASPGSGRPKNFSSEGNRGSIRRDGLDFGEFHKQLLDSALLMRLGQADLFHARIVTHGAAKEKLFRPGNCTIPRSRFVNILKHWLRHDLAAEDGPFSSGEDGPVS